MQTAKNILIIKLSWIGDILFTLPAFYQLRQNLPDAHITVLTAPNNAPIFRGFPDINRLLLLDRRIYKSKNLPAIVKHSKELFREIKQAKFDLAIDYQGSGETAMISYLTGAPQRLGIVKKNRKIPAKFYTCYMENDDQFHRIDQSLSLLSNFGFESHPVINQYNLPPENLKKAQDFLLTSGYSLTKPILYIQPFSGKDYKNWPINNFHALAGYWKNRGVQVVFGGGPADIELLKSVATEFLSTAGKTDLLTSAAIMKLASLVIGNDTGPLHLAVALQKRVIMLMGPSETIEYGPYQHPEWVLRPHGSTNINEITLDEVIKASTKAFAELKVISEA